MSLIDTRSWFRLTLRIKANRSSAFINNMGCTHCDTGSDETQENLELCTGFAHEQRDLKINTVKEMSMFCKRMVPKSKSLANEDNLKELKKKFKQKKTTKKRIDTRMIKTRGTT